MAKKSSTESSKKKKNKSKNKIKSKLSILNSEAKKTKAPQENPFESIWSRRKFDILGKKRKDDERRRVGLSRSLAIQKRQKTLLKEYEQSTKSSVFCDKRIGEQNEGLGEFDKAILRSQRERQVSRQSQKFCPEAITFIQTMLMAALNNKKRCEDSQLYHLMELKTLRPLLSVQGRIEKINSLDFLMLMDLPDDSPYFASDMFRDVAGRIESKSQEHNLLRQPLRLRKQKIIKTAVPKFEENFVKGRDYDPDRERAERKKLKKRLKQEAKGAVRELRKDNHFLLEVKERDKAQMEAEKAEKYGKYRAFLQEQEHAFKSGQLGKGRKRRR
ncbi:UNVERIFIED_CONTAM: hypothetical protein Sangu_1788300 [Sesamum angustifolium]|uniref:Uncharacterized protein n=1 Tax=Sesamum angustifolium TaxID=2727405 RepID=A0AAW2M7N2_9LAMI